MPAETSAAEAHASAALIAGFIDHLRDREISVSVDGLVTFAAALDCLGFATPRRVYWAGRTTLVHRDVDLPLYDEAFREYWLAETNDGLRLPGRKERDVAELPSSEGCGNSEGADPVHLSYSAVETLRTKDFAACSEDELEEINRLVEHVPVVLPLRRTRRHRRSSASRGHPDLRRTVRAAISTDGEPLERIYFDQVERPRRLVLLCDVSGSMDEYARVMLRFLHLAIRTYPRTEAFAIGTRLTRLTRQLSGHDPDAAIRAASDTIKDWSGGTRLGEGMAEFNDRYGVRGMARGAIVVICSDGWDTGNSEELGAQMARLHRVAHRVIWVNQLKATEGYEPLAKGMAAALPHVDDFREGHSLASLESLAEALAA